MERISTAEIFRNGLASIQQQQASTQRLQEQIATGERLSQPSDDPVGVARVLELDSALSANEQQGRNTDFARGRLERTEGALQSVGESLQRVRELVVQGANDSNSQADRATIAQEIRQELDAVFNSANATGPDGEFLFAGSKTQTQPFVRSGGDISYQGDNGQRFVEIGPGEQLAVNDPGRDVFMEAPASQGSFEVDADNGNTGTGTIARGSVTDASAFTPDTYTVEFTSADEFEITDSSGSVIDDSSGNPVTNVSYNAGDSITKIPGVQFQIDGAPASGDQFTVEARTVQNGDIFSTVRDAAQTMEVGGGDPASDAQFRTDVNRALTELDGAIDANADQRAEIGTRLERLDRQETTNSDVELSLESRRSRIADTDITQAASDLRQQLTSLQAAQQSFARIQEISLFNFI